ncbi:hypothetical protein [Methylobacterium sp. PvR107]|jgi:hypothetical protein|uniref:hypothetical protein n=1 Tax=Methylobacterium sp. PvR107 TaxID=2806597 RepID=UPI001AE1BC02|nr:hypothetical protein [Methylobacterium sp. PvR107]MBP1182917.1 hypothetical protein [Methylobacterium sp. PvR107]
MVEVHDLAVRVAALSPDGVSSFEAEVAMLRGERARAEEERLARLKAMADHEVVATVLLWVQPDPRDVLRHLREAGFVRGTDLLEAAYRAGFAASGEGWNGEYPGDADRDPTFDDRLRANLANVIRKA